MLLVKNLPANAGDTGDQGSILELGRSPGEGNGNPLQYSCLENLMNRQTLWTIGLQRIRHDWSNLAHTSFSGLKKQWNHKDPAKTLEADRPGLATWLMPTGHPFPMNRLSGGSVSSDYRWMRAVGLLLHSLPTKQVSDWIPPHTPVFVSKET